MGCAGSSVAARDAEHIGAAEDAGAPALDFHLQYQLRGELGRGSFAQVHRAIRVADPNADEVAVKVADLRAWEENNWTGEFSRGTETDRKLASVAEHEAQVLRMLGSHPHVVHMLREFREESFSYIVMEKCDRTLLQVLEGGPEITEQSLAKLFKGMVKGIFHVHSMSVVHRDIKPDNFLCCGFHTNTVKLCDFDLASVDADHGCNLRGACGTAQFMSPEMLGTDGYGAPTDIWSFGVLAHVLLLGCFPYQPAGATKAATKAAILAGEPAPTFKSFSEGAGEASDGAVHFLKALLQRDPLGRPTAKEVLRHGWMSSKAEADLPSRWPMLHAAKQAGAFGTRKPEARSEHDKNNTDATLAALQAKHHKVDPQAYKSTDSSGTSTSFGSSQRSKSKESVHSNSSSRAMTRSRSKESVHSNPSSKAGSRAGSKQSSRSISEFIPSASSPLGAASARALGLPAY